MYDVGTSKMLANYRLRAENVQLYDMPKSNHFLSQLHIKVQGESPLPGGQINFFYLHFGSISVIE